MRTFGFYWGIFGVTAIISSAVYRLLPRALELGDAVLTWPHWLTLLLFTPYMAYAEGYKGFHLNFAPRVIARASHLKTGHHPVLAILAPLFCMGYFYATRKRMIISVLVTTAIIVLVLLVSQLSQPWRGVIDVGVITGLVIGVGSIMWYWLRLEFSQIEPGVSADLPQ